MFSLLFSLFQGLLTLWGWVRGNKDQQIGRLGQENKNAMATLDAAQNAISIRQRVENKSDRQLNTDLARRMRRTDIDD